MAKALIDRSSRLPLLGWTALVAVAAMSTAFAWSGVFGDIGVEVGAPERLAVVPNPRPLAPVNGTPTQQAHTLLSKPVFLPGRALPKVVSASAPAPAEVITVSDDATLPAYLVGGVVITPATRKALLRTQDGESGDWVSEGEITGQGWTIASIGPNRVLLARGGRQVALELYKTQ